MCKELYDIPGWHFLKICFTLTMEFGIYVQAMGRVKP